MNAVVDIRFMLS